MYRSKTQNAAPYIGAIPQFLVASTPAVLAETHPLVDELVDVAKDALGNLVRGTLAGAGRHFTARAEKCEGNETLRRENLNALHTLRLSTGAMHRAFGASLDRAMATNAVEQAASAPIKLSPPCANLWRALSEQLGDLSGKLSVAPVAARFAPERVQSALRNAIARAELPARTSDLVLEMLETGVFSHLDQVYRRVAERIEQYSLPGEGITFPIAANQPAPSSTTPALHVDPYTKALLVEISQSRETAEARRTGYTNAQLAAELLENIKAERNEGTVPVRGRAIIQRLALVGRMFGAVRLEARLPAKFHENFEALRFPVIKSALADSSFFSQRTHSLRLIAADLVQKGAQAFLCNGEDSRHLAELLDRHAGDFDLSAAFVRPALSGLRPLPSKVIDEFLADLQDEVESRANWARDRARKVAAAAIERRYMGKLIPYSVLPLINEYWMQVLAHRLLAQGHGGAAWDEGIECLDLLMEHALGDNPSAPLDARLHQRLAAGLKEAGLSEALLTTDARVPRHAVPKVDFEPIFEVPAPAGIPLEAAPIAGPVEVDAAATAAAPPAAPEVPAHALLRDLLSRARWYRVFDHRQEKLRWLRLEAFHPEHDSVAFAEFDGKNPLKMQAALFLHDLRTGRSAPTNPDVHVRGLLQQLQKEHDAA
jgi:hypothetical protein